MRPSAFKKITISGLALAALGVSLGLVLTESSGQAQQQKDKEKGKAAAPAPVPALLQNYAPVTADRLKNPGDGDWLMIRRTYNGWGYSPLNQINATNVFTLRSIQDSNKLLASLLELQTIAAKQQREMTTNAINAEISRQTSLSTNLTQVTGTLTSSLQNFRMP